MAVIKMPVSMVRKAKGDRGSNPNRATTSGEAPVKKVSTSNSPHSFICSACSVCLELHYSVTLLVPVDLVHLLCRTRRTEQLSLCTCALILTADCSFC
jgi:hypothetical protein